MAGILTDFRGLINKVRKIWRFIIDDSSLQVRIFHAYCCLSFLAILFIIPLKFYLELYTTVILASILEVTIVLGYYLSRFCRRADIGIPFTAIAVNVLFALNYFYNGGIASSEILLMSFSFFAIITVTPKAEHWAWTVISIIIFLVPIGLEYFQPYVIQDRYRSRNIYFLDTIATYIILIALMRVVIPYILRNYDFARNYAEQKAAALDTLNHEKSKLISIIAHDIRAPLSNIQNYLELIAEDDIDREEMMMVKSKLLQSTASTIDILNNLLNWSRSQMETREHVFERVDLNKIMLEEHQLYYNIASNKNITLDYIIASSVYINGNKEMIKLIIRNLVNNAIKFTSPGGSILVIADTNESNCIIEVRDTGTGSPVYLDDRIFDFSVKATYGTNNEKGVGMGLVLCKEYAEAQKGKIWYATDKISGTSFYLQLPLYSEN
ncbi:sensor histidine kinase [Mucilaginibacter sp. KACC 22063]|uniref:sensor histidine kinase n=1 Tax=Mucilaginibacter sp. KACC 22063 TaxID=3025666 RepID=UPI002365915F|nr:HAMP domain-containing sensor histidine kinase [Mucilaginibacter sp. KACC 22063]WDF53817.1 HAMP domain-containing sensor histidine kinase [Mucilaginibacter sp. KACC 22063]